ncbi:unnamed protein product [Porites evermanni]|uniref:Uncharacterized protein n=1 Tax=Porites evermanni TaxID=104178 RepID=A0ABN8RQ93_9CNID|nr:unnamed protein product [Porites evermanni]
MNRNLLFLTALVLLGACVVLAGQSQRGKAILHRLKLLSDQELFNAQVTGLETSNAERKPRERCYAGIGCTQSG